MKKFLGITAITLLGLIFRLIFINKPDGLWNDEYVSWTISSTPLFNGFMNAVKSQCHMPFYYLYMKVYMFFFGQSDLALRISSVIPGILAIPVMYFVGKEKNEKTGIYCAVLTAISSFLIYYSQEVRLYSILFLFSALCILYTLKCIKAPTVKNLTLFLLFNFLILFTHTIGFVFVFFNLIFISINLYGKFKKLILSVWTGIIACAIVLSPLIFNIFTTKSFSQWWGHFSISKIGFLFTDYFSPVLTNLTNAPDNFFYMPKLAFFMIIPAFIAIFCIIKAVIKNRINIQLFFIALCTISVLVIAAISGKLVFLTKYSIEIYPILILLACEGACSINNKVLRNTLITIYCLISAGYIILFPYSAPKMRRPEGHKIMTDILEQMQLNKGDIILLEYYPKYRFEKYFDFSDYRVVEIHKGNFPGFFSEHNSYEQAYLNGKNDYLNTFKNYDNKYYESMLDKNIFNKLEPGQNLVMVILNSVAFHSPADMKNIALTPDLYNKEPLLFLIFSYVKNKTFEDAMKKLTITSFAQKGNWTLIKFTKLNKQTKF